MPATDFPEYARTLSATLDAFVAAGQIRSTDLQADHRSAVRGFVSGLLIFEDGSEPHFREFVDISLGEPRVMYAYHYQSSSGELVFRYDNAVHRPPTSLGQHKHTVAGAAPFPAPAFAAVIQEAITVVDRLA